MLPLHVTIKDNSFPALFRQAVEGVLSQGMQCTDGDCCQYRYEDDNGHVTACAVGHIITDEAYSARANYLYNNCVGDMNVQQAIEDSIGRQLESEEIEILTELQKAHDDCAGKAFNIAGKYMSEKYRTPGTPEYNSWAMINFRFAVNKICDEYGLPRYLS